MKWVSKNKKKKFSLKRFIFSFGYAFRGILTVYKTEQNIFVHTIATLIVIALSIYLKISRIEACIIAIVVGMVIAFEILNTALEYTVDMSMPSIHPLAKMAKDAASGAVLVSAITSLIVGGIVFIPKIMLLIHG